MNIFPVNVYLKIVFREPDIYKRKKSQMVFFALVNVEFPNSSLLLCADGEKKPVWVQLQDVKLIQ